MDTQTVKGRASTGLPVLFLVVVLIALTIGLGYVFYTLYRDAEYDRASAQMAADVQTLAGNLSRSASLAALGDPQAPGGARGEDYGVHIWPPPSRGAN